MNVICLAELFNKINDLKSKNTICINTDCTVEQLVLMLKEIKIKELAEELNKLSN